MHIYILRTRVCVCEWLKTHDLTDLLINEVIFGRFLSSGINEKIHDSILIYWFYISLQICCWLKLFGVRNPFLKSQVPWMLLGQELHIFAISVPNIIS